MKTKNKIIIIACLALCISRVGGAEGIKLYKSPDRKLIANVITKYNGSSKLKESKIEIISKAGIILLSKDYSSEDGEHGLVIENIKWTPDSKFLIYITFSSGGHQAWAYPSYFYSVKDNIVFDFSDYFPAVAEPNIEVTKPGIVKISIWTPLTEEHNIDESIILPVSFRISDLLKKKGVN